MRQSGRSGQKAIGELVIAADVGQPLLAALEEIRQLAVVQAEQLEDRGVQVVDVHAVLDGAEAEFVGGADDLAPLDPAAGQPDR